MKGDLGANTVLHIPLFVDGVLGEPGEGTLIMTVSGKPCCLLVFIEIQKRVVFSCDLLNLAAFSFKVASKGSASS